MCRVVSAAPGGGGGCTRAAINSSPPSRQSALPPTGLSCRGAAEAGGSELPFFSAAAVSRVTKFFTGRPIDFSPDCFRRILRDSAGREGSPGELGG